MMLNQFFFQSLTSVSSVEGFWCKVSFRFKCSTSPQTLANSTHPTLFLTCDNVSIRFEFVTRSCCVFCVLNLSYFNAWAGVLLLLKKLCPASVNDSMTEEAIHKWVQHHLRIDQIRFQGLFLTSGIMEQTRWWPPSRNMTRLKMLKLMRRSSASKISLSMKSWKSSWRMWSE